jgi:hypothetical protein
MMVAAASDFAQHHLKPTYTITLPASRLTNSVKPLSLSFEDDVPVSL